MLGIKLNSSDYIGAGSAHDSRAEEEAEDRAVAHVVDIALWDMIDFIEISGGDYENPGTTSNSTLFTWSPLRSYIHLSRISFHGSPSLLLSLCAQSALRHPRLDISLATPVGSPHRWNAVSRHVSRCAFSRTRRPHRHRPRKRARSQLAGASRGVLLTSTSGYPGRQR